MTDAGIGVVLDASALLAYWLDEPGAEVVTDHMGRKGAVISSANFAEALTKILDRKPELRDELPGAPPWLPDEEAALLTGLPLAGGAISVEPFTIADAVLCAWLRQPTRRIGLSLGDRACLALGRRMRLPVLTADREWTAVSVGVEVRLIR